MAAPVVQSGIYYIQNKGTGTVLDLNGGLNANNTKVQGFAKHELNDDWVPAQLWVISQVGNEPVYTIQNANSRTFLDLTDGNVAPGTPIVGFQPTSNPNQRWIITRNANNTAYVIKNQAAGTYVDLYGGGSANGTAINGYPGEGPNTGNANQLWHIVRA